MAETKNRIKVAIIVLSVLVALSVCALAGVTVYRQYFQHRNSASDSVSENIITPESEKPEENSDKNEFGTLGGSTDESDRTATAVAVSNLSEVLTLHKYKTEDNVPFLARNLFPGDTQTRRYCVRASHDSDVTIRFHADIRPGYEKLAEVLKCRVYIPSSNEVLYDGLMRDMPPSVDHMLKTNVRTDTDLYYEITVYLDTSVGNEYQAQSLIADFRWWTENTGALTAPQTGDGMLLMIPAATAIISLLLLILLIAKRRKEEGKA